MLIYLHGEEQAPAKKFFNEIPCKRLLNRQMSFANYVIRSTFLRR